MKKSKTRKSNSSVNPVAMAVKNATPLPVALLEKMCLLEWSSIESFDKGRGTLRDAEMLQELQCMCQCCIDLGIGPEVQEICSGAAIVLTVAMSRLSSNETISLDAVQINVLRDLQAVHQQQRTMISRGEYSKVVAMANDMLIRRVNPGSSD